MKNIICGYVLRSQKLEIVWGKKKKKSIVIFKKMAAFFFPHPEAALLSHRNKCFILFEEKLTDFRKKTSQTRR